MKTVILHSWAKVKIDINPDTGKYEVVSSEQPTNEELTEMLYRAGTMPMSENFGLLNKTTFDPID